MKQSKKIYSLVLESKDQVFLSTQLAESLEEAFALANIEFTKTNPLLSKILPFNGSKIWLFNIKTIPELIGTKEIKKGEVKNIYKRMIGNPIEDINEDEAKIVKEIIESINNPVTNEGHLDKNKVMQDIIKNKDIDLLKEHKDLFTKNEIRYIKDNIK